MLNWFERLLSVAAGVAALIMFSNLAELDWQLVLISLRDATHGGWVPEFRVDMDMERMKRMWS